MESLEGKRGKKSGDEQHKTCSRHRERRIEKREERKCETHTREERKVTERAEKEKELPLSFPMERRHQQAAEQDNPHCKDGIHPRPELKEKESRKIENGTKRAERKIPIRND